MPVARLSDLADVERACSTSGSGDGEVCEPLSWLGDEECFANMNALCIPGNRLAPLNDAGTMLTEEQAHFNKYHQLTRCPSERVNARLHAFYVIECRRFGRGRRCGVLCPGVLPQRGGSGAAAKHSRSRRPVTSLYFSVV
jgi:hypothetical protein